MNNEDPQKGKCVGCAFLAMKSIPYLEGRHYHEAEVDPRADGKLFTISVVGDHKPVSPVCFRGCLSFGDEMDPKLWKDRAQINSPLGTKKDRQGELWAVMKVAIERDRACSKWRRYHPGIEPERALEFQWHEDIDAKTGRQQRRITALEIALAVFAIVLSLCVITREALLYEWIFGRAPIATPQPPPSSSSATPLHPGDASPKPAVPPPPASGRPAKS